MLQIRQAAAAAAAGSGGCAGLPEIGIRIKLQCSLLGILPSEIRVQFVIMEQAAALPAAPAAAAATSIGGGGDAIIVHPFLYNLKQADLKVPTATSPSFKKALLASAVKNDKDAAIYVDDLDGARRALATGLAHDAAARCCPPLPAARRCRCRTGMG